MSAKFKSKRHYIKFTAKLLVIVAALVLILIILTNHSNRSGGSNQQPATAATTSQTADAYAILSPATVPSKTAECSQSVTYSSSGSPSPLQCSNGNLNIVAWQALSAQEPKVMSLGYSPSASDLQAAVCSDINAAASDSVAGADNAIEQAVLQIASLYYGWSFANITGYSANC